MTWTLAIVEADGTHVETLDRLGGSMTLTSSSPHPNRLTANVGPKALRQLTAGRFVTVAQDGAPAEWFYPQAPARHLTVAAEEFSLPGIDCTLALSRAKLRRGLTIPRGSFVREAVLGLLAEYAPLVRAAVGDNDGSLREELAYAPGAELHQPINAALLAGGMTALLPRAGGRLESVPWTAPSERPTAAVFAADTEPTSAPFLPDMTVDGASPEPSVNEVLAITRGTPPIVGRWADEAAIVEHGLVTEVVPGEVDATDLAAAFVIARRHAETLRHRRQLAFTGVYRPLRPGDVVEVRWPRWGVAGRWEIVSMRVSLSLSGDTAYDLMEV